MYILDRKSEAIWILADFSFASILYVFGLGKIIILFKKKTKKLKVF